MNIHQEHSLLRTFLKRLGSTYQYTSPVLADDGSIDTYKKPELHELKQPLVRQAREPNVRPTQAPAAPGPSALDFAALGQTFEPRRLRREEAFPLAGATVEVAPPKPKALDFIERHTDPDLNLVAVQRNSPNPQQLRAYGPSALDLIDQGDRGPILNEALKGTIVHSAHVISALDFAIDSPATVLALSLENKGHKLLRRDGKLFLTNSSNLTDEDRTQIKLYKPELLALASPWIEPSNSLVTFINFVNTPIIDWKPDEPPSLDGIDNIIINFATTGLNWHSGDRPAGVTVSTMDGKLTRFLPFAFKGGGNLDESTVKRWFEREVRNKHIKNSKTKFDIHHARVWGIDLEAQGCTFSDIQHTAALLDDHRKRFSIDILAKDYLNDIIVARVDESQHTEYHASEVHAREIYTAQLVGRLHDVMYPQIIEQELQAVHELENEVITCVVEMEKNGSPIDEALLAQYGAECSTKHDELMWEISRECGFAFEHTAKGWERLINSLHLPVPDSFSEEILNEVDHPLVRKGQRASQYASLNSKIFKSYPEHITDGILRYNINQLVSDEGGTVSGRFSIGVVQQVPSEDNHTAAFGDNLFPRRLYIPGSGQYLEGDAAQIEFRLLVHYSQNAKLLQAYKDDHEMSFHKKMQKMLEFYKPDMLYTHTKSYNFACVSPETPILTADFRWVPAGSLKEGDYLLAFSENYSDEEHSRAKARRWEMSEVIHNQIEQRECVEVLLGNGDRVICTIDHPWLVLNGKHFRRKFWRKSSELRPGFHRVIRYITPWEPDLSWEAGWLAGFLDGEGCVSKSGTISCNQNKGPTLEFAHRLLQEKAKQVTRNPHTGGSTEALSVVGTIHERIKFLGRIRPQRLLRNFLGYIDEKMAQIEEIVEVLSVTSIGLHSIAALGTTSKTYIANGYAMHNSQYGAKSIKLAVMMEFITKREGEEIRRAKRWDDPRLDLIHEIEGAYDQAHPEARALLDRASHLAKFECDEYCKKGDALHREYPHRGYVKTLMGRRSRFPTNYKTYIGLNRVLQGTGADIMKKKIVELHKMRKDTGFVMRITNHDAVLGDATTPETLGKVTEILNKQSFQLRVPILWKCGVGSSWATTK